MHMTMTLPVTCLSQQVLGPDIYTLPAITLITLITAITDITPIPPYTIVYICICLMHKSI